MGNSKWGRKSGNLITPSSRGHITRLIATKEPSSTDFGTHLVIFGVQTRNPVRLISFHETECMF